jgi:cellulose biosynthesis protein BcsQ
LGRLTRFSLWFSDFYIVPTIPDFLSARMLYSTVRGIEEYKNINDDQGADQPGTCCFAGIVITKYQTQIQTHDKLISDIENEPALPDVPNKVFKPYIRQSVELVRPFEEYPLKIDGSIGKRRTNPSDDRLIPIYSSYNQKYKQDLAGNLLALANSIKEHLKKSDVYEIKK